MTVDGARTEADLRAALSVLAENPPAVADVLPTTDARRRRPLRWVAPLAAALVVAGVAAVVASRPGPTRPAEPTAVAGLPIVGRTWEIDGSSPSGVSLRIEPNGRFFAGIAYCTSLVGRLRIEPTELTVESARVSPGLCPAPAKMPQTSPPPVRDLFRNTLSWRVDGDRLTLTRAGRALTYVRYENSPAQVKIWTYRGVGIVLPADWPADATRCGVPIHNTVVFPGPAATCDGAPQHAITSVTFADLPVAPLRLAPPAAPLAVTEVDGYLARSSDGVAASGAHRGQQVFQLQFLDLGVAVTIASPRRAEAYGLSQQVYLVEP